jgi:hypothetical protein
VTIINAHTFNVGFASAQLAERVENAGAMCVSERITIAATAIADYEAQGEPWDGDKRNYDFILDEVAKLVSLAEYPDSVTLEGFYRQVQKIVIKGGAK